MENILYLNFRNDVSFQIEHKFLIFAEHQSTINFNLPLRSLMYVGRAYEQMVSVRDRYHKKRIMLPTPEFYVFYNGKEPFSKETVLNLSDSFLNNDTYMLEVKVKVKVININLGAKHPILESCKILKEYSIFVETVRKYQQEDKENAIERSIDECTKKGILKEYLMRKGS